MGFTKHGMHKSRLYNIWEHMKCRCLNQNHTKFRNYGGRGIKLCDEWIDFVPFMEWALGNGYHEDLTIDRIDNDGNYEPENCRWVTHAQQMRNMSTNRKVVRSDGMEFGSVGEAAEVTGTFPQNVFRILRKERKTTKGYSFEYID